MVNLSSILKAVVREDIEEGIKASAVDSVGLIAGRQGKFSGELRASNNIGVNSPDLSSITVANYIKDAISGTQELAVANARQVVQKFKLGDSLHLTNSKDHAKYDEYRWGRLAYTSTADVFQNTLDKNIK